MIRPAAAKPRPPGARRGWLALALVAAGLLAACDRAAPPTPSAAPAPMPPTTMPSAPTARTPAEWARFVAEREAALKAGDADALAQVSAALHHDAPGVVLALARGPATSHGAALAAWARAQWQAGQVEPLARVFAQLALGADLQQDAVQHFGAGPLAADGSPSHAHAVAMGYYVGVLQAGLQAAARREGERQALVTGLLRSAAAQAGVPEPDASLPAPGAAPGKRWVRYNLYPALASTRDAADRLFWAAQPVASRGVLPNGEPDLEAAAGSGAQTAFLRRQQDSHRALER